MLIADITKPFNRSFMRAEINNTLPGWRMKGERGSGEKLHDRESAENMAVAAHRSEKPPSAAECSGTILGRAEMSR